jgi:formyl-CoA transferase
MTLPLKEIRVLELSRVLAGPYCGMLLGDLGADVVKVERPGTGDDTRQWGPPYVGDQSAYFLCCNRNKRSVTINLHHDEGRRLARRLALASDVLIENFLPGTLAGWGLGYEELSAANPRLVYSSITGFGQDGPYRDVPGYDIIIQAMAGVMSITGQGDGPPTKVGVAISDITAGLFAANAILAALVGRASSGRGQYIDISLMDSTLAWLANVGANYLATGRVPQRLGNAHANIVPYQSFETADRPVIVAVGNDGQWQRFCKAIDRADLAADARYATNPLRVQNRGALIPNLEAWLKRQPADHWLSLLAGAEVPCGPVNTLDRVFTDPQVQHRQQLLDLTHPTAGPIHLVGPPWKLGDAPALEHRPPPCLGQHTAEVLNAWLGLHAAEVERLAQSGAV